MKSRTHRPFTSLALTSGFVILGAFMFPACGADTEGIFQSSAGANTSSSSGQGGEAGSGGQGGSNASSSSGQSVSSSSSSGQGGGAGQGGSSGQSSSSSSSSSSGGMGMPEDCLDGLDNDLDGDIDCADSDCSSTGFTCTDEAPQGWTSVAIERGMGAAPPPMPCPDGTIAESLFTGPAGAAQCTACSCGAITGNTCNPPGLACFVGSNNCGSGQQDWTDDFGNGNCAKPDIGVTFNLSCRLSSAATVDQAGSCPPSTSDFPNKDTWSGWLQACGVTAVGGGCATGTVCVAKPPANQSLCIRQDGDKMCPTGWNTVNGFVDGVDDRTCSECSCVPNATCVGGSYQVFDSNNCDPNGGNPITVNNNTCRNVSGQLDFGSWSVQRNLPTPGGLCTPMGGEAKGGVQTKGPVTFCCK